MDWRQWCRLGSYHKAKLSCFALSSKGWKNRSARYRHHDARSQWMIRRYHMGRLTSMFQGEFDW